MARFLTAVILVAVIGNSTEAQYTACSGADSILEQHLLTIGKLADRFLSDPNRFVSGRLYLPRGTRDNNPYFLDNEWKSGSVQFNGVRFSVSMMKYDLEIDAPVILKVYENTGYSISLDKRLIPEFTIADHRFVYFEKARMTGYYEELYNLRTGLWAKWTKWGKLDANSVSGTPVYNSRLFFIIRRNNEYYEAKNLKELLKIYADRKPELQQFIRANRLSYIRDKTGTVLKLTEQYDMLNN